MATAVLEKKRKNIDLPTDVLQKLSVLAASQGKSLKAFIEHLLVAKANSISVEVSETQVLQVILFLKIPIIGQRLKCG